MIANPEERPVEIVHQERQAYFTTILTQHADATFEDLLERAQDLAEKIKARERELAAEVRSLPDEAALWTRYERIQKLQGRHLAVLDAMIRWRIAGRPVSRSYTPGPTPSTSALDLAQDIFSLC